MGTHTRGPWTFVPLQWNGEPHTPESPGSIMSVDHGWYIATVEPGCDQGDVGRVEGEHHTHEDEANAQLIAAAPDLLEALRDVLDTTADPDKGAYHAEALKARQNATHAIRKAEGSA